MNRRLAAVGLSAALLVGLAACGGREDSASADGCSPGISDSEVTLGMSIPQSGAGAAYGALAEVSKAYFEDINEAGGVEMADGKTRTINLLVEDDAYDPARTVSNTKKLVEEDGVAAIYSVLGTSPTLAIADYAKAKEVPVLFSQTGTDEIFNNHEDNPWVMGQLPQYQFEAKVMADYVKEHAPNGKVGILYQNDGFGKGMVANFQAEFEGTDIEIVSEQGYEQSGGSIDSQIVNMQSAGADVFLNYATGTFMTQALKKKGELGWDALTMLTSGSSDAATLVAPAGKAGTEGAMTFRWTKDMGDPAYDNDEGVLAWNEFAENHGIDPENGLASTGYLTAELMVETLAGTDGCTSQDILDSAYNLKDVESGLLLPGVTINTTPEYPYVITQVQMLKFDGSIWHAEGDVIKHSN